MPIKVTRPNVVVEMLAEEWDLIWGFLKQLDYSDFHDKMSKDAASKLAEIVQTMRENLAPRDSE